jgi:integrase
MQKKPLAELLNELEQEMLRLGYIRDFLGHVDIKTTEMYARPIRKRNDRRLKVPIPT